MFAYQTSKMYLWSVFLLSLGISVNHVLSELDVEYTNRVLHQICEYSNFCSKVASKQLPPKSSACCKPCSCNQTCLSNGNCCPDFPHIDKMTSPVTSCRPPVHFMDKLALTIMNGLNFGFNFYYTFDSCPASYTEKLTIDKCVSNTTNELDEMAVVSDKAGRVFKNIHCAKCHGVEEFIRWKLWLRCSLTFPDKDFAHLVMNADLLSGPCILYSSPPNYEVGLPSRCFRNTYTTCNETGNWEEFDGRIQNACESAYSYPYVEEGPSVTIYKNPFCFLCNSKERSLPADVCTPDDQPIRNFAGIAFSASMDYAALEALKALKREASDDLQEQTSCGREETWDPFFNRCRQMFCPVESLPAYGTCITPFDIANSLVLAFQLKVRIHPLNADPSVDLATMRPTAINAMARDFRKRFELEAVGCYSCNTDVHEFPSTDLEELLMIPAFQTSNLCQISDIYAALVALVGQNTSPITSKKVKFTYTISFASKIRSLLDLNYRPYTKMHQIIFNVPCHRQILITDTKFYCPSIRLTQKEFTQIVGGSVKGSGAVVEDFNAVQAPRSNASETVDNIYCICVADYMREGNNNGNNHIGSILVTVMLEVIVCMHFHL